MKKNKKIMLNYSMAIFAILGGLWLGDLWSRDFVTSNDSLIAQLIGVGGMFSFMLGCYYELYFAKREK